jgi:hypothetical protein
MDGLGGPMVGDELPHEVDAAFLFGYVGDGA